MFATRYRLEVTEDTSGKFVARTDFLPYIFRTPVFGHFLPVTSRERRSSVHHREWRDKREWIAFFLCVGVFFPFTLLSWTALSWTVIILSCFPFSTPFYTTFLWEKTFKFWAFRIYIGAEVRFSVVVEKCDSNTDYFHAPQQRRFVAVIRWVEANFSAPEEKPHYTLMPIPSHLRQTEVVVFGCCYWVSWHWLPYF